MTSRFTNSVFVVGLPRWVKQRQAGKSTVTQFSLGHVDKLENKHYFKVEMWNVSEEDMKLLDNDGLILVKAALKYNEYENKEGAKQRETLLHGFSFEPYVEGQAKTEASEPKKLIDAEEDPFGF